MISLSRQLIILSMLTCYSLPLHANSEIQQYIHDLQQQALNKSLHTHPYWLALGHYYEKGTENYQSYTDDKNFFLSQEGKSSPKQELLETISHLADTEDLDRKIGNSDTHARCRFVARYAWLEQQLMIKLGKFPRVDCQDYNNWRTTINPGRISIIFASHFVNSPSSMYGHTLLRIDPPKNADSSEWLSYAVNFGADITSDDTSILYAYKGLTGGYPGKFNLNPYYKKIKEYGSIENRGLWEYELNLTAEEVNSLVAHLWELKDIEFDYFFADENCSFRLLELLEISRPDIDLLKSFQLRAIPTDTIREIEINDLISAKDYRPSQMEKIQYIINSLTHTERDIAILLSENTDNLQHDGYTQLSQTSKKNTLYVAYHYLRYQQRQVVRDKDIAKRSHRLLQEINTLGEKSDVTVPSSIDPIDGHETTLVSVSHGIHDSESFIDLEWRMSYHDLLDPSQGYPQGLAISMLSLTGRLWDSGNTTIEDFNLVDIQSIAPRDKFFKPLSWRAQAGWQRMYSSQGSQLVPQVNGGAGVSFNLQQQTLAYGFITARLEHNQSYKQNNQLAVGLSVGLLGSAGALNFLLDASTSQLANGTERSSLTLGANYHVDNNALRLELKHTQEDAYRTDSIQLSYRLYY